MTAVAVVDVIEVAPYGFVVTVDGEGWPKTPWGRRLLAFEERERADEFAVAVEGEDAASCHRLIAEHGRWYEATT